MAEAFAQSKCPVAQRIYLWQERCVMSRFPSPLSIQAARHVIREECFIAGYDAPVVRSNFLQKPEFNHILAGVDPKGKIYLRPQVNKAIVLHELAHYFQFATQQPMEHDAVFMRHFLRLLERNGVGDLERSVRAYELPF